MPRISPSVTTISAALLAFAFAVPASAQLSRDVVNGVLVGLAPGVGARAAGMGDAHVAVASDATAMYWNPAGLALQPATGLHFPSVRYSGEALSISDLTDMLDIAHGGRNLRMADYLLLQQYLGPNAHAEASAMGAWRDGRWAFGAYAQGMAEFAVEDIGSDRLAVTGFGLDATSYGLAYADRISEGLYWGAQAGLLKIGVGRTRGRVGDNGDGTYTSTVTHNTNHASDWNLNAGLMYQPNDNVRWGLVGRNLNSPGINYWQDFTVEYEPSLHAGVAVWSDDGRTLGALDLHNVFEAKGEGSELCLGLEHQVSDTVALRAGLKGDETNLGAGFTLANWAISVASGLPFNEELSLTAGTDF